MSLVQITEPFICAVMQDCNKEIKSTNQRLFPATERQL